jgi:uncharacterized membrane protein YqhA
MSKILSSSRYLILIAVVAVFLAGLALLVYGGFATFYTLMDVIDAHKFDGKEIKNLALGFIQVVDLFLLAAVFHVIALGLYELFIDESIRVPDWLEIHDLDDLKDKLVKGVVVVMAVLFLGQAISWDGETNLLVLGGGMALMIAALTYFMTEKKKVAKEKKDEKA